MFTIAGILADEEPKTAISASGLYNSSSPSTSDPSYTYSSNLLSGRSEFSIMVWVYVDSSAQSNFNLKPYLESSGVTQNIKPIIIRETSVECVISNSNGGITTVSSTTANNKGSFIHLCVTGSVSNNRIRIYRNGTLLSTAVMTYANATSTEAITFSTSLIDLAQLNIYDRELPQEEVAEHYVYDSDTSQAGVLGYDAMTTSQKSGLLYSSSFIDNISFSGNEFKDRSGNDITLSPQPDLTGQQIYVYTDASDLPSDEPNAFAPNVATLDGSTQYFDAGNPSEFNSLNELSIVLWVKPTSTGSSRILASKWEGSSNQRSFDVNLNTTNTPTFSLSVDGSTSDQLTFSSSIPTGSFSHVVVTYDGTTKRGYINGVATGTEARTGGIFDSTSSLALGADSAGTGSFLSGQLGGISIYNRALTSTEITALYNDGEVPCYADIDTSITDDCVYAPNLMTFNGRTEASALVDNSSSGITTTAVGSPTYEPTGALIVSDGGVQYNVSYANLDGSTQYYDGSDLLKNSSAFSVWGWVKVNDTSDNQFVTETSSLNTGSTRLQFGVSGTYLRVFYRSSDGQNTVSLSDTEVFPVDEWVFVGFSIDCNTDEIALYKNDTRIFDDTQNPVQCENLDSATGVRIGRFGDNAEYLDGSIALVGMSNTDALTQSEFTSIYNDDTPQAYVDVDSSVQSKTNRYYNLSNWNGNDGSETDDQTGNGNTLTAVGSPTYESELAVECDEDPV